MVSEKKRRAGSRTLPDESRLKVPNDCGPRISHRTLSEIRSEVDELVVLAALKKPGGDDLQRCISAMDTISRHMKCDDDQQSHSTDAGPRGSPAEQVNEPRPRGTEMSAAATVSEPCALRSFVRQKYVQRDGGLCQAVSARRSTLMVCISCQTLLI